MLSIASAVTAAAPMAAAVVAAPPMGWASWNSFAAKINYTVIKAQTDALVSSGLKDAGYQYVNIDEGWWQGTRDAAGNIVVDTTEWPGGMKAIADYIHGKGLKAGIYTDAGRDGCGYYFPTGRPAAPGSGRAPATTTIRTCSSPVCPDSRPRRTGHTSACGPSPVRPCWPATTSPR